MSKLSVQKVSADESRNLPVFAEFNEIADRIRNRAYKLFEDRGYEPDEISVTAAPNDIIVKADHESKKESEESFKRFSEFRSNRVYRRFGLPASIKTDKVEAKFKNGMLTIEAKKLAEERPKPKRVEIQTAA